jgi:4-hydroxy-tetrahydrodipicolinate synthase
MAIQNASDINGVYTALFTPLKNDDPKRLNNVIDYEKSTQMIEDLIEAGIQGIVPVGTTGQSATLSHQQHLEFIRFVHKQINNRVDIIAGAGSNCTRESVEMIHKIQAIAPMPVLCVTGYYNNPTQAGIVKHFQTLSSETGAKIVLYNVPSRTNSYIAPESVIELAQDPNIIALKQAVDFKQGGDHRADTLKIQDQTKDLDFTLISGEDDALFDLMEIGGTGIISATANIPEAVTQFIDLMKSYRNGHQESAKKIQVALSDFISAIFIRKNPIPLGTFFNSPLYQPLSSVIDTENGAEAKKVILDLIENKASSLKKYR